MVRISRSSSAISMVVGVLILGSVIRSALCQIAGQFAVYEKIPSTLAARVGARRDHTAQKLGQGLQFYGLDQMNVESRLQRAAAGFRLAVAGQGDEQRRGQRGLGA